MLSYCVVTAATGLTVYQNSFSSARTPYATSPKVPTPLAYKPTNQSKRLGN
jgi:hypothetical protein